MPLVPVLAAPTTSSASRAAPVASAVMELKVIDDQGNEVPTNARGELAILPAGVFRGYWNRPDANAETFLPGG